MLSWYVVGSLRTDSGHQPRGTFNTNYGVDLPTDTSAHPSFCIQRQVDTCCDGNRDIGLPIIIALSYYYNLGQTNSISGVFVVFFMVNDNDISTLLEPCAS
jgi:hypothetical protein